MDFTIVKIMNELGVSEEEARALVEFDLKHKKVEETGKIEKSVLEGAGAEQLTKNTKNTKNTQNSKNTENTKNTISNAESVISNTEKVDNRNAERLQKLSNMILSHFRGTDQKSFLAMSDKDFETWLNETKMLLENGVDYRNEHRNN